MATLGCGQDAFNPCKLLRRLKHTGLLYGNRLHQAVCVQLGKGGAHAVISQAARMVGRRDEAAAQRIHFCKRTHHSGIAEVVCEFSSGKAGAGCRFHCDKAVILLAPELLAHKRCDQTAQIGTAARTADDDVRLHAVLIQRSLALKSDHRLMQQHLIQHASQHITIAFRMGCHLNCLGDGGEGVTSAP